MSLPITMQAVMPSTQLCVTEHVLPAVGSRDILIEVAAAGVNRADLLQCAGNYPPPAGVTNILGLEVAGSVVAVGAHVTQHKVGDRVMALLAGGGYAGYVSVDERQVLPVPEDFTWVQAAAIPETFFTVWDNVFNRASLQSGERLLVHGGTSGIGTTAIQLAKAMGAEVLTTAGSAAKCRYCLELGASAAINYHEGDFVEQVLAYTQGHGVDVILDMIGGDYVERNFKVAALEARIVQIAFMGGRTVELDLGKLMTKRIRFIGGALRSQSAAQKEVIAKALVDKVYPLWRQARLKPVIDSVFTLNEVAKAHERMNEAHIGKILLKTK